MNKGDIVLIPFPFTDKFQTKRTVLFQKNGSFLFYKH